MTIYYITITAILAIYIDMVDCMVRANIHSDALLLCCVANFHGLC